MKKLSNIQRILSLMLVIIAMVTVIPTTAFAANYDPNAKENFVIENGVLTQYLGAGEGLHVVVPDGVREIGTQSFYAHDGLVSVVLPDSVTKIGVAAFGACPNLTSVNLPNSIVEIDEYAFGFTGLTNITIPEKLSVIRKQAFYGTEITSITIPDNITWIDERAFFDCKNLSEVNIGKGTVRVDPEAFEGCYKLQNFNVDPENENLWDVDGVLYGTIKVIHDPDTKIATEYPNSLLTYPIGRSGVYVIPDGTGGIGPSAFTLSKGLTNVVIPGSVRVIGVKAFMACQGLTTLTIPEGVETIMDNALFCGIVNIIVPKSVTKIDQHALGKSVSVSTLYVQPGSYAETYAKANNIKFSTGTPYDSASDWARAGIASAVAKGFVPGDLQNQYKNIITRAEFCRMAVKFVEYRTGKTIDAVLDEKGVSRNSNAFSDTDDPDILAAFALGITSGTGNGTFTPNGQFSREQAATMIMNTCKVIGMDTASSPASGFADINTASTWAVDGINFVGANGIMNGTGNNAFSPKGTYTRQESIVTFDRIK